MAPDQSTAQTDSKAARLNAFIWLTLVFATAAAFVTYFARFYSFLPDDGAYAWVAQQILEGKILHRDVQDVHAGYINFANSMALNVFGQSLFSMRIPLVIFTATQAALMFWIARRSSLSIALAVAVVFMTMTFVQFINPSANWYSLFGTVLTITWLSMTSGATRGRLLLTGLLLGTVLMVRQLSGVILAVGVLALLMYESAQQDTRAQRGLIGPSVLITLVLLLGVYAWNHSNPPTFVLFAMWPLFLALLIGWRARISNADSVRLLFSLGAGAAIAALPIVTYHLIHDSLGYWLHDTVLVALQLADSEFTRELSYSLYLFGSLQNIMSMQPGRVINGLYWMVLIVAPTVLGLRLITAAWQRRTLPYPALTVIASFYALVSLHYQSPTYLYFSSALTLAAVAVTIANGPAASPRFAVAMLIFVAATGSWFHAAQPPERYVGKVLEGERLTLGKPCPIERLGVKIATDTCEAYRELLSLIDRHSSADQTILAIPVNPELYFLSDRQAAAPFFNSALGLTGDGALAELEQDLSNAPPALVFFHPDDKYNTQQSQQLMEWVRDRYRLIANVDEWEIYTPR